MIIVCFQEGEPLRRWIGFCIAGVGFWCSQVNFPFAGLINFRCLISEYKRKKGICNILNDNSILGRVDVLIYRPPIFG